MENLINQAFGGLTLQDNVNSEAVADLLDRFGLRWTVQKEPLYLSDNRQTDLFAIVRQDTEQVFQSCKDSYVPYQNSELAELLIRISEKTGYAIHKGGMFNGGAKVYLQLNTGNSIPLIGKNNDKVKGFVTGINSHDGSISLKWGLANITISCQNTFSMASRQLQNKAKHTNNMHNKVDQHLREIGYVVEQERNLFEQFIRLSDAGVTKELLGKVVKDITSVDVFDKGYKDNDKYSTYQVNRTGELLTSIQSEMAQKGETLWGLLSGVTHYTSHVFPVAKRENAREESKYVGYAAKIDNAAFNTLVGALN
jgi:phage/plasmid-like protein (TIGR03299 family)